MNRGVDHVVMGVYHIMKQVTLLEHRPDVLGIQGPEKNVTSKLTNLKKTSNNMLILNYTVAVLLKK